MTGPLPFETWPSDIRRFFNRHGVLTWEDLAGKTESALLVWNGFGAKRMQCVRELVAKDGLKLPHIRTPDDVRPVMSPKDHARFRALPTQGIYFLEVAGFIKIGVGSCVIDRVGTIETSIPLVLNRLGFIHVADYRHLMRDERELHRRFAVHRHKREWFRDVPEIRAYIQDHAQPWPVRK